MTIRAPCKGIRRRLDARRTPVPARRRRILRGQAMVEFALVAPFFFALLFGVIEFALIGSSIASFNFAAKDGARIGSFLGRTDSTVDQQIVSEIRSRVQGVVLAQTQKIEVFKSDVSGAAPSSVEYVYDISGNVIGSNTWPVDSRNDTLSDADYLGVRITYLYTYLTGFVAGGNSTLQLTATSVQRIEPQDFQGRLLPNWTPGQAIMALAAPTSVRGVAAPAAGAGMLMSTDAVLPAKESRRWNWGGV